MSTTIETLSRRTGRSAATTGKTNGRAARKITKINGYSIDDPAIEAAADRIRAGTHTPDDLDLAIAWPFHVEGVTNHELVNAHRTKANEATDHSALLAAQCLLRQKNLDCATHPILTFYTPAQIASISTANTDWIIPGFLAREAITELDGKIKASGKTTFALDATRSIITGQTFLGYPTQRSKVVYITEQQRGPFLAALRRARLENAEDLLILFRADFQGLPWPRIIELAVARCGAFGANVLVADTIAKLAGVKEENSAGDWNDAMTPLQNAADTGLAVWPLRHSRKGAGDVGDTGRGSSAASGDADIILELRRPEGNVPSTRRVLESLSRYDETPEKIVIDLTTEGYVLLGSDEAVSIADGCRFVSAHIYSEFGRKESGVTQDKLVTAGQSNDPPLSRSTIKRAIKELLARNEILQAGTGVRGDPFHYQPIAPAENTHEAILIPFARNKN